ncbi:MAG: hypothetical protein R3E55_08115 [Burkholderiaceae bacterium]
MIARLQTLLTLGIVLGHLAWLLGVAAFARMGPGRLGAGWLFWPGGWACSSC